MNQARAAVPLALTNSYSYGDSQLSQLAIEENREALTSSLERVTAKDDTKIGSEFSFGLVFAAVFAVIGLLPLVHGGHIRLWSLVVSLVFLIVALTFPRLLGPLNRLWFKFGLLLHHIINPVILGAIFFAIITPLGVITRWAGGKLLTLGYDSKAVTYWEKRTPPGPDPDSIRNQF
jgi:hypothetical protein